MVTAMGFVRSASGCTRGRELQTTQLSHRPYRIAFTATSCSAYLRYSAGFVFCRWFECRPWATRTRHPHI
jgi:hypothetical protein